MKDDPGAAGAWLRNILFNVKRWVKCVWFARTNAWQLSMTAQENGVLWGKLATAHDELRFVKRELDEVVAYGKGDPVSLASHYRVDAAIAHEDGALVREEYQRVLIELVSTRKYVELGLLRRGKEAPDAVARRMAEDTGAQWVEEIYPKLADALGVPAHKQNAKRLDHNHNRAVIDQRDSMIYGGR